VVLGVERVEMGRSRETMALLAALVVLVGVVVTGVEGVCSCVRDEGRACTAAFLESASPVDICREREVACGPCFCDPDGPLSCETAVVGGYSIVDASTNECVAIEVTLATCPAVPTSTAAPPPTQVPTPIPTPSAVPPPTQVPTPTPTEIPVEVLPTPRPILTEAPTPTPIPGDYIELVTSCSIEALVPWVRPLRCNISANSVPPNAIVRGAVARINQGANGTATLFNNKATVANGTYQAIIFNYIEPEQYWEDWVDIRTNLRRVVLEPFSSSTEIARRPRFDAFVYATPAFVAYAQNRLVVQRLDVQVTFLTDKLLAISNAFTGGRIDNAWAFADIELVLQYTLG